MKKFLNCCLITLCYWLIMFIGPGLVLLWNNFSYYVAGLGYGSESFMYKLLTFLSQPIACLAAVGVAGSLFDGKHKLCTLVNCVIGTCLCTVIAILNFCLSKNFLLVGELAVSAIVSIIIAGMLSKSIVCIEAEEFKDLNEHKTECYKLMEKLSQYEEAMFVLEMLAEKSNTSVVAIADQLFVNYHKHGGYSEEDARAMLNTWKQNRLN